MSRPDVLVVSSFEAEMQPLAAACAAAALRASGASVSAWDAHLFPENPPDRSVDLVLLSVQQFEGVERGLDLAKRLRNGHPDALLVAFGQYAQMNSRVFLDVVDGIVMDEPERVGAEMAEAASGRLRLAEVPAVLSAEGLRGLSARRRLAIPAPARDLFPSLVHYPAHHRSVRVDGQRRGVPGLSPQMHLLLGVRGV